MGRSNMASLKIIFLPLAICLLLSLNSQVSGKPSPKHLLIETKENAKKMPRDNNGGKFSRVSFKRRANAKDLKNSDYCIFYPHTTDCYFHVSQLSVNCIHGCI